MNTNRIIKVGLIGAGERGAGVMVGSYLKIKGWHLTAICDKYEDRVKKAHAKIGDPAIHCYTDHARMLKEADIEAVVIAVEPENNAAVVCDALAAGKHVMCDVPLAFTLEDCWKAVVAVERGGRLKFQMGEQMRYAPYIQAWKKMNQEGVLGKIIFVEGQYFHGMGDGAYWMDADTGQSLSNAQAVNNPKARKSRLWTTEHPIWYLPHELSPILNVLDDRVNTVSCMATRKRSYHYEWFDHSDIEVALMHTDKDTILRLAAGFIVPSINPTHWYHIMGTKGRVETNRYEHEPMKLWLAGSYMRNPAALNWEFDSTTTPKEALTSGHGGVDYWAMATFLDSIREDKNPPMDIYRAAEAAAPAILAGCSAELGGQLLAVPDFRPNTNRQAGKWPSNIGNDKAALSNI